MMPHSEKAGSLLVYVLRYKANHSPSYTSKWVRIVLPVALQDLVMLIFDDKTKESVFNKYSNTLQKD